MKVRFGDEELDLNNIHSVSDLITVAENIKPLDKSLLPSASMKPSKEQMLFDECTGKEHALRYLCHVLQEEERKLRKELFSPDVGNLMLLAQQAGKEDLVSIPPVDMEDYANLQKLSYARTFLTQYVAVLIQSRVGFGLNLALSNSGQIYCLRDLRELHTASI